MRGEVLPLGQQAESDADTGCWRQTKYEKKTHTYSTHTSCGHSDLGYFCVLFKIICEIRLYFSCYFWLAFSYSQKLDLYFGVFTGGGSHWIETAFLTTTYSQVNNAACNPTLSFLMLSQDVLSLLLHIKSIRLKEQRVTFIVIKLKEKQYVSNSRSFV